MKVGILALVLAAIAALSLAAIAATAHADPLDEPPRYPVEQPQPRPHYLPNSERTQRRYLPSWQYELERRKICGDLCDDVTRRRPGPFDR